MIVSCRAKPANRAAWLYPAHSWAGLFSRSNMRKPHPHYGSTHLPEPTKEAAGSDFPDCFASAQQFREWRLMAIRAKEAVSICDDCSAQYAAQMRSEGRCHPDYAKRRFTINSKASRDKEVA